MGVERAVTRWYAQRHTLLQEIAQLKEQLAQSSPPVVSPEDASQPVRATHPDAVALQEQLAKTWDKVHALGPCPKPMMG